MSRAIGSIIVLFVAVYLGGGMIITILSAWWNRPRPDDCPRCNFRREGETLKALKANFCPKCGHLLTDQQTAKSWMWMQRQMLDERKTLSQ